MRVGRVALVEERVAERERRAEVGVELREAATGDEALVDDRPRRGGRHGQVAQARRPRGGLEATPRDDEPPLERFLTKLGWPRHDDLHECRHLSGGRSPHRRTVVRHIAPAGDAQAGGR